MTHFFTTTALALAMASSTTLAAPQPTLADARLEAHITTAILFNRHLNPFEISVEVQGDTAILTGTVDEAIDKELAERVALNAKGIAHVDNQIRVDPEWKAPARPTTERSFGERVADATTTATVKSRLLWNQRTSGLSITVETHDGHVTLDGEVASQDEKSYAERLALDNDGVKSVKNLLRVTNAPSSGPSEAVKQASEVLSDAWITTRIKSSLLYSRNVKGLDVTVATTEGVVTLGGTASTTAERDLAIEIAKDIRGVTRVDARNVKIRP